MESLKRQAQLAVEWRRRRAARGVSLCVWRAPFVSSVGDGSSHHVALLCCMC